MSILFTNNAGTSLASSITTSATSLTVASGAGALFPNPTSPDYFLCTLANVSGSTTEIVKVTSRSGDTFTIVRAQEGTTASAFSTSDFVQLRITAAAMQGAAQSGLAGGAITENSNTVSSSYTISTNKNAISAGPVTINTGVTVTVPTGSRWVIV
jgi:hypothetical protein